MKKLLFAVVFVSAFVAVTQTAVAQQCDKSRLSPIKCGYFEEGYQDGAADGKSNRDNDYKRYRSKLDDQYESFYRSGYDDGFASVKPFARWTDRQKNTYEQGFDDGRDDLRRKISRLPARYEGQYNREFEAYYRRGYLDGYDNREKTYDQPIGPRGGVQTPNFPGTGVNPRGTSTGRVNWNGLVDERVNIIIKGDKVRTQPVRGSLTNTYQNITGVLPRRGATLSVRKLDGRGTAVVTQQPSRANEFTGIVQVYDQKRGRDNYNLQISWTSVNTVEAYSAGRVTWKGRVDQTATIRISGDSVDTIDEAGTGLSGVVFNLDGYLAARNGNVRVNKRDGRGTVYVLEQPSARNGYTALIRIFDERGGDDEYSLDIEW